jgi:hypothetical protein
MPLTHDQVLAYVIERGPCVPNEIRQALAAQDNFVVGAVLSELTSAGKLAISDLSLGTSKFYYDPNQPQSLEKISQYLGEKDIRAYQLLKAEQVVRHSELTPILRVGMAMIKDFSRPLRVQTPDGEELFWRYYLLPDEQAFELVKRKYYGEPKEQPPASAQPEPEKPTPDVKSVPKPRKKAVQQPLPLTTAQQPAPSLADGFAAEVHKYFESKQIGLLSIVDNKKTELSCLVAVPSAIGPVQYFCKAKAKKTTNEGDLAAAQLEAQQHKLPLLYVCGGTLTKKAQDLLATQLRGIVVVQPWA